MGIEDIVTPYFSIPYKGKGGEEVINKFKGQIKRYLPTNVKPRFTYKGKKLSSNFPVKDKVKKEHQSNLVYGCKPISTKKSKYAYIGETNVRLGSRTHQHGYTDEKSSLYKYLQQEKIIVSVDDFEILGKGYNKLPDRKIAEALYVKDLKPELNKQKDCYRLDLFN